MGKSLREALEEQMAALRAQGLAPDVVPDGIEPNEVLPTNGYDEEPVRGGRRLGKRAAAKRRIDRPVLARTAATVTAEPRVAQPVARPSGHNKVLERRPQPRRPQDNQREQVRQQLSSLHGSEIDEAGLSAFLRDLAEETGALPPMHVVLEALRTSDSSSPAAVAGAVRRYYRRPRPVPATDSAPIEPPVEEHE